MEYINNGGYKMPILGLGTYTATTETDLVDGLNEALRLGYRHIDTASLYANEHFIGKVLHEWLSSGKLKRDDLFITTKLGLFDTYPEQIEEALKSSLEKLQLEYVDLYLVHFPVPLKMIDEKPVPQPVDHLAIWRKMEEQVDAGRTKNIGLSNFNMAQIDKIKKNARIQPANIQIELHLYHQQKDMQEYAKKNNLSLVGYSPLGTPGTNEYRASNNMSLLNLPNVLQDETLLRIAAKYKKTPAQIILRFIVQCGVATIPKSTNPKRLAENFNIFDYKLSAEDMKILKSLDKGPQGKIFIFDFFENMTEQPEFPFKDLLVK